MASLQQLQNAYHLGTVNAQNGDAFAVSVAFHAASHYISALETELRHAQAKEQIR